jgi:hypothetical protein
MITKNDAAKAVLGKMTFDCALPQEWLNDAQQSTGRNVSGDFVWCYPDGDIWGFAMPITRCGYSLQASGTIAGIERVRVILFNLDRYSFEVPPVNTGYWSRNDWISYIVQNGSFSAGFIA